MKIFQKKIGLWIGILLILIFACYLWVDVRKERTYYHYFKESGYIISLDTNMINYKDIFNYIEKEKDILKIKKYIEKKNIKRYLINSAGSMISKGNHPVGLEDPSNGKIYTIVNLNNHALFMNTIGDVLITVISDNYDKDKEIFEIIKNQNVEEVKKMKDNISIIWYYGDGNYESLDNLKLIQ